MARLDQLEGQAEQLGAVFRRHLGIARRARQQRLELRQVLGGDEAELLEEFMARRQVREQFDHRLGDTPANGDEVVGQPGLVEHRQHVVVLGQPVGIEGGGRPPCRTTGSPPALRGVVALGVECLHQRLQRRVGRALLQRRARLQDVLRRLRMRLVDRPRRLNWKTSLADRHSPGCRSCAWSIPPHSPRPPICSRSNPPRCRAPDCRRARFPSGQRLHASSWPKSSRFDRRDRSPPQAIAPCWSARSLKI